MEGFDFVRCNHAYRDNTAVNMPWNGYGDWDRDAADGFCLQVDF